MRRLAERRVLEVEAREAIDDLRRALQNAKWGVLEGFATEAVREDRDEDC